MDLEANENNNLYTPSLDEGLQPGMDLEAAELTVKATQFGQTVPVSIRVRNRGIDPAPETTAEIWLSPSPTLPEPPGNSQAAMLATVSVPALGAGAAFAAAPLVRLTPARASFSTGRTASCAS